MNATKTHPERKSPAGAAAWKERKAKRNADRPKQDYQIGGWRRDNGMTSSEVA